MPLLVAAAYAAVIAGILWVSNALHSELCTYPDEPAHYVNGLLIREYLTHGIPQSPMKFAIEYYLHYPKVTFGHWPPLFHVVEGLWMTLFSSSRTSTGVMMGCWTLLLAMALWRACARFGPIVSFAIGLFFLLLPITQDQLTMIMTEIPLAALSLLAVMAWARYLDAGRRRDAVWFGVWALNAILVKGDAWALGPAAALVVLLTGRWQRMRERAFWIPVLIAGIACVPYYWRTRAWAALGWAGGPSASWKFTRDAIAKITPVFPAQLGWPTIIALLVGIAGYLLIRKYRSDVFLGVMFSFVIAATALEVIVPAGIEGRKIYFLLPECLILAALGIEMSAGVLPAALGRVRMPALAVAVLAASMILTFTVVRRFDRGFRDLATMLHNRFPNQNIGVMVTSSGPFEGAIVSEMANVFPYPSVYVLRATEFLTDVDWLFPVRLLYSSPEEVEGALQRSHARVLIVHHMAWQSWALPDLLDTFVSINCSHWSLIFDRSSHTDRGYERVQAWDLQTPPAEPDLEPVMKRLLERRLKPAHVDESSK